MKQIWPTYAYSPTTNVLTLTGLNIDRDRLLLVTAADRGRIMYNFADSSVTASAFTSGANTALTLVATTAGLTTTAALVIYFDDQATSSTVTGTVELGPTSLNALESITVTMGQVTVTGGLTDVQLRASAVTVGGTVTVGNFPASQAVTFGAVTGSVSVLNFPASQAVTFSAVSISNFPSTQTIAGTVTANLSSGTTANPIYNYILECDNDIVIGNTNPLPISGTVTIGSALPAGTNRIGVVTIGNIQRSGDGVQSSLLTEIGSGYLLTRSVIAEGTAQIGSVTASISNSVTIGSLPTISGTVTANVGNISAFIGGGYNNLEEFAGAGGIAVDVVDGTITLGAGTAQIGSVTASISNSVTIGSLPAISGTVTANLTISATAITSGSFASLTSATLVPGNTARKMATVYNLGAGQLFVNAGATATTLGGGFMVALSSGDFYECDYTTTTLSAIFATAGTASWMSH